MPKERSKSRISTIQNNEAVELSDTDARAVQSVQKEQDRRDAAKDTARLAFKGRPLSKKLEKLIKESGNL